MDESRSPHPFSASPGGGDDEVLRYLQFSDPDFAEPLALPPPNPDLPVTDNLSAEVPMQDLTFWDFPNEPPPPAAETPATFSTTTQLPPFDCRDCVVLREVVHSNGSKNMRLCVHGSLGKFYHATLEVRNHTDGFPSTMEQSYIDLSKQSFERVKQFLIDYGFLRFQDKYELTQDSVSAFFDALCVRMSSDSAASTSRGGLHLPAEAGLCHSRPATVHDAASRASKTRIAAQRERTGKLHLKDLAEFFHLPISEAAKELRICSTALKKICRKHGMPRWPHRKIKSIDRRISNLLHDLNADGDQVAANTKAEIERLEAQRAKISAGLPP